MIIVGVSRGYNSSKVRDCFEGVFDSVEEINAMYNFEEPVKEEEFNEDYVCRIDDRGPFAFFRIDGYSKDSD